MIRYNASGHYRRYANVIHDGAVMVQDETGDWCQWDDVESLQERITKLEIALREIRDSKYCSYSGPGPYTIGVTDGHRYCSVIAREAME